MYGIFVKSFCVWSCTEIKRPNKPPRGYIAQSDYRENSDLSSSCTLITINEDVSGGGGGEGGEDKGEGGGTKTDANQQGSRTVEDRDTDQSVVSSSEAGEDGSSQKFSIGDQGGDDVDGTRVNPQEKAVKESDEEEVPHVSMMEVQHGQKRFRSFTSTPKRSGKP